MSHAMRAAASIGCCCILLFSGCSDPRRFAVGDGSATPDPGAGQDRGSGAAADAGPVLEEQTDRDEGCATNAECYEHEYCHREGACAVTGAAMGLCRPRPDNCSTIGAPVCGCDGQTYGNECSARAAGINVAHAGECRGECGTLLFLPACPAGQACDFASCGAAIGTCVEQPVTCPPNAEPDPVCGCDEQDYVNDCWRQLAGVARKHGGSCAAGAVTLTTDRASYDEGDAIQLTLTNGTQQSIFLPGCSVFSFARYEGGVWVERGPVVFCAWEGLAIEIEPQRVFAVSRFQVGGMWRAEVTYGVGCTRNKTLSQADCAAMHTVQSAPFAVLPAKEACTALTAEYQYELSRAKQCDYAVNHAQCQALVEQVIGCPAGGCWTYVNDPTGLEALQQHWTDTRCDQRNDLATCIPGVCNKPVAAGCSTDNACVDDFGDGSS